MTAKNRTFTCIETSEICLQTMLQEMPQRLDMRTGITPFYKKVLNHVMNRLGPWQGPALWTELHFFDWKEEKKQQKYVNVYSMFSKPFIPTKGYTLI